MNRLYWTQEWRKAWSLCNASRSHSSASGERVQNMEEPQLTLEAQARCLSWRKARLDWK